MRIKTPTKEPARERRVVLGPNVTIPDNEDLINKILVKVLNAETFRVPGDPEEHSKVNCMEPPIEDIFPDQEGTYPKPTTITFTNPHTRIQETLVRLVLDPSQKVPFSELVLDSDQNQIAHNVTTTTKNARDRLGETHLLDAMYLRDYRGSTQTYGELYVRAEAVQYESDPPYPPDSEVEREKDRVTFLSSSNGMDHARSLLKAKYNNRKNRYITHSIPLEFQNKPILDILRKKPAKFIVKNSHTRETRTYVRLRTEESNRGLDTQFFIDLDLETNDSPYEDPHSISFCNSVVTPYRQILQIDEGLWLSGEDEINKRDREVEANPPEDYFARYQTFGEIYIDEAMLKPVYVTDKPEPITI